MTLKIKYLPLQYNLVKIKQRKNQNKISLYLQNKEEIRIWGIILIYEQGND
jgi:hypothetical protein